MGSWARGQTDPGPLPQLPPAPFLEHHLFPVFIPVTSIPRSASSCLSATSEHSGVLIQLPLLSSWPAPLPSPPPGRPHSLRDPVGALRCPPPHSLLLTAPAPRAHAAHLSLQKLPTARFLSLLPAMRGSATPPSGAGPAAQGRDPAAAAGDPQQQSTACLATGRSASACHGTGRLGGPPPPA